MSADRWSICPRCLRKRDATFHAVRKAVQAKYGNIPAADYLQLEHSMSVPPVIEESLREDYEFFFTNEGIFTASYSSKCQNTGCGFAFTFQESRPMPVVPL